MTTNAEKYRLQILKGLEESAKSFNILFDLKHYKNCISIICQELDQIVKLLFLLKSSPLEKEHFTSAAINNQRWYSVGKNNKKEYLSPEVFSRFAETLQGWEGRLYSFGTSFKSLSNNFNYLLKDPISGLNEEERAKIHRYITEYHDKNFPVTFSLSDLVPLLQPFFEKLAQNFRAYLTQL